MPLGCNATAVRKCFPVSQNLLPKHNLSWGAFSKDPRRNGMVLPYLVSQCEDLTVRYKTQNHSASGVVGGEVGLPCKHEDLHEFGSCIKAGCGGGHSQSTAGKMETNGSPELTG